MKGLPKSERIISKFVNSSSASNFVLYSFSIWLPRDWRRNEPERERPDRDKSDNRGANWRRQGDEGPRDQDKENKSAWRPGTGTWRDRERKKNEEWGPRWAKILKFTFKKQCFYLIIIKGGMDKMRKIEGFLKRKTDKGQVSKIVGAQGTAIAGVRGTKTVEAPEMTIVEVQEMRIAGVPGTTTAGALETTTAADLVWTIVVDQETTTVRCVVSTILGGTTVGHAEMIAVQCVETTTAVGPGERKAGEWTTIAVQEERTGR